MRISTGPQRVSRERIEDLSHSQVITVLGTIKNDSGSPLSPSIKNELEDEHSRGLGSILGREQLAGSSLSGSCTSTGIEGDSALA